MRRLEGIGSARALARLVERDRAFRWPAGGAPVNHHGWSDFRVAHAEALDRALPPAPAVTLCFGATQA